MPGSCSLAESLASLSEEERDEAISSLTDEQAARILYDWRGTFARQNQLEPPGDWRNWLILAGRGFGKTRTGAEFVREQVELRKARRIAFIGHTVADVRKVMIEGESGLLACYPPGEGPVYKPSERSVEWSNGAIGTTYSGDSPDQLRGPQHDLYWCDEPAKFAYLQDCWDNLQFGLRLGNAPRGVLTTTPKPLALIRQLVRDQPATVVTRGSTYDNASNLPAATLAEFRKKYEGTRLGRQELFAEILDDAPGALWKRQSFDGHRVKEAPELTRVVVAVDPAVTDTEHSDESGIVAAGRGIDGHAYILDDWSLRSSPGEWAKKAIELYKHRRADIIIAEVNKGGDLVISTIRVVDPNAPVRKTRATQGKVLRAEPVAALYEQGRVHHVGNFDALEDQMCMFTTGAYVGPGSPDRADAAVYAITDLILDAPGEGLLEYYRRMNEKKD
jgi:phage terminase large subunit-like protein